MHNLNVAQFSLVLILGLGQGDLRALWGRDGREAQKDQLRHWISEFPTLDLIPPFPFLESQHFLLWFVCFQQ